MLLHYGIANAASHNNKFTILITAVDHENTGWDTSNPTDFDNQDWDKDSQFVPIQGVIEWNGDDDGSGIVESVFITLMGPGGKAMGSIL
jgi:hypothetical protein